MHHTVLSRWRGWFKAQVHGVVKVSKGWLTHPLFATPRALRWSLAGAVSLQNTAIASNMILDTSCNARWVERVFSVSFGLQFGAGIDNILHFLMLRLMEFRFLAICDGTDGFGAWGCCEC